VAAWLGPTTYLHAIQSPVCMLLCVWQLSCLLPQVHGEVVAWMGPPCPSALVSQQRGAFMQHYLPGEGHAAGGDTRWGLTSAGVDSIRWGPCRAGMHSLHPLHLCLLPSTSPVFPSRPHKRTSTRSTTHTTTTTHSHPHPQPHPHPHPPTHHTRLHLLYLLPPHSPPHPTHPTHPPGEEAPRGYVSTCPPEVITLGGVGVGQQRLAVGLLVATAFRFRWVGPRGRGCRGEGWRDLL
jgi:hypothetical protein